MNADMNAIPFLRRPVRLCMAAAVLAVLPGLGAQAADQFRTIPSPGRSALSRLVTCETVPPGGTASFGRLEQRRDGRFDRRPAIQTRVRCLNTGDVPLTVSFYLDAQGFDLKDQALDTSISLPPNLETEAVIDYRGTGIQGMRLEEPRRAAERADIVVRAANISGEVRVPLSPSVQVAYLPFGSNQTLPPVSASPERQRQAQLQSAINNLRPASAAAAPAPSAAPAAAAPASR
jgi:hypothetical protein